MYGRPAGRPLTEDRSTTPTPRKACSGEECLVSSWPPTKPEESKSRSAGPRTTSGPAAASSRTSATASCQPPWPARPPAYWDKLDQPQTYTYIPDIGRPGSSANTRRTRRGVAPSQRPRHTDHATTRRHRVPLRESAPHQGPRHTAPDAPWTRPGQSNCPGSPRDAVPIRGTVHRGQHQDDDQARRSSHPHRASPRRHARDLPPRTAPRSGLTIPRRARHIPLRARPRQTPQPDTTPRRGLRARLQRPAGIGGTLRLFPRRDAQARDRKRHRVIPLGRPVQAPGAAASCRGVSAFLRSGHQVEEEGHVATTRRCRGYLGRSDRAGDQAGRFRNCAARLQPSSCSSTSVSTSVRGERAGCYCWLLDRSSPNRWHGAARPGSGHPAAAAPWSHLGDRSDPLGSARGQHHPRQQRRPRGRSATSDTRDLRVSVSTASRSPSISFSQVAPRHDHTRRGGTPAGATLDGRPATVSHRRLQPASSVLPAGVSPGSTVLPEMVRPAPVAWVISTRRGWLRDDAGMVTCRTPSA